MTRFLLRRLGQALAVVFGVALLTFLLFHAFAPDPVRAALGQHANASSWRRCARSGGWTGRCLQQFWLFLSQIIHFDFGRSFVNGDDLATLIGNGAWVSLAVTVPPFVAGLLISVAVALFVAYHRGGRIDRLSRALFVGGMSVSALVYVIVLQYGLAYKLGWFPINGYAGGWAAPHYLLLPWLILLAVSIGPDVRLYRNVLLTKCVPTTCAPRARRARARPACWCDTCCRTRPFPSSPTRSARCPS
jgi:peptide/nickel transport system permease protein